MAQRNSASANDARTASGAREAPETASPSGDCGAERRRARAYLDLWERQLTHVAAQAAPSEPFLRKGAKARA